MIQSITSHACLIYQLILYILKQLFFSISVNSGRIFTSPLRGSVNILDFRIIVKYCMERWTRDHTIPVNSAMAPAL